jgi:XTP/dITP diphosphohydrolase
MQILIGTNNFNKFKNYKDAFNLYAPKIELLKVSDAKVFEEPEEDCDSLLGNAIKKAKFFGEKTGIITLADDTGLFVDAINGEPGINTKRWHKGNDHDRCVKLSERLKDIPTEKCTARYKWAVAAYNPLDNKIWEFECGLEGFISDEFRDAGGFGYDKMFKIASMDKYYSELSTQELIEIGGRGRAVKELIVNKSFIKYHEI